MMNWDQTVNQVYDGMTTEDLDRELRDTRGQISRDFAVADMLKDAGCESLANPRRKAAIALTRRAKRISAILNSRGNKKETP